MRVPRALEPLRHRDFRLLWTGQTVSAVGNSSTALRCRCTKHVPPNVMGRVMSIDYFGGTLLLPIAPIVFAAVITRSARPRRSSSVACSR